ncbi:hypothetical protein NDU88_007820, partial [Pleurodeles waltl]
RSKVQQVSSEHTTSRDKRLCKNQERLQATNNGFLDLKTCGECRPRPEVKDESRMTGAPANLEDGAKVDSPVRRTVQKSTKAAGSCLVQEMSHIELLDAGFLRCWIPPTSLGSSKYTVCVKK